MAQLSCVKSCDNLNFKLSPKPKSKAILYTISKKNFDIKMAKSAVMEQHYLFSSDIISCYRTLTSLAAIVYSYLCMIYRLCQYSVPISGMKTGCIIISIYFARYSMVFS